MCAEPFFVVLPYRKYISQIIRIVYICIIDQSIAIIVSYTFDKKSSWKTS